jgi:hypothetical protein
VGTAFGFWYYIPQFRLESVLAWPVIPDSPTATLFIACSLALYKLGRPNEYLNVLAFFGCIKHFAPIVGTPHHTLLPVEPIVNGTVQHVSPEHEIAAAGAVVLTIVATALAVAIGRQKRVLTAN